MSLKLRLTAMMVGLLVLVVALQFMLMERERRQLQQKLSQLSSRVDQTTAVFVQQLAQGGIPPRIDDFLRTVGADSLTRFTTGGVNGNAIRIMVTSDSIATRFPSHGALHEPANAGTELQRTVARPPKGVEMEEIVVLDSTGTPTFQRRVYRSAHPPGSDSTRAQVYVHRDAFWRSIARADSATTPGRDFVINLPVPAPEGDSLFSLQMRYSYAGLEEEIARSRRRGLLWLVAILGGGVLAAVAVAIQFTRPIQTLRGAFRRVEHGDLSARAPVGRHDEIGALTSSFNEMVTQLQESKQLEVRLAEAESLAAVGRLAAGVAHEVRNPLNTILLTMQHLRDKMSGGDFERHCEVVTGEIARLDRLVGSFLDLARATASQRESFDVSRSVRDAAELYAPAASQRGVTLAADVEPDLTVLADPTRLPMVWSNLVANALEATPRGGSVRITARRRGGEIEVEVADTGAGVAPEQRARIWEPFVTGRADGTGLGLAIVHSVVERHGGSIELDCPPAGGTRMIVRLPVATADATPGTAA